MPISSPKSIVSFQAGLRASGKSSTATIRPTRMSTARNWSKSIVMGPRSRTGSCGTGVFERARGCRRRAPCPRRRRAWPAAAASRRRARPGPAAGAARAGRTAAACGSTRNDERVARDRVDARLALLDRLEVGEALLERVQLVRGDDRQRRRRRRPCRRAAAAARRRIESRPLRSQVQPLARGRLELLHPGRVAQVERDRLLAHDVRPVRGRAAAASRPRPRRARAATSTASTAQRAARGQRRELLAERRAMVGRDERH